jgi:hypothetical protein
MPFIPKKKFLGRGGEKVERNKGEIARKRGEIFGIPIQYFSG